MTSQQHKTPTTSTNNGMVLSLLRTFFRYGGKIAPGFTLKILWSLIFKPRRKALRPPHFALIEQAEKSTVPVRLDTIGQTKVNLTLYKWGKSDRKILLVHGWQSHALDFYKLIPQLVRKGYEVIAFDAPGHGKSEGKQSNVIAYKQAIHQVILRVGEPYAVIGHSFGGFASAFTLSEYPLRVRKFVMIANPVVGKHMFEHICEELDVPGKVRNMLYERIRGHFSRPIEDFDLNILKYPIKADEILLIYDQSDEMVSYLDIDHFLRSNPRVKSRKYDGIGHFKIVKNQEVMDQIIGYVN